MSHGPSGSGVPRRLRDGAFSALRIVDLTSGIDTLMSRFTTLIEAPNWTPDGAALIVNGGGRLWQIALDAPDRLQPIATGGIEAINNDHLLSPNGTTHYVSASGAVHAVAAAGGPAVRLTPGDERRFYLHGVSPDGSLLACTVIDDRRHERRWSIALLSASTDECVRTLLTSSRPVDGPEWTPDGTWLWYNAEPEDAALGHAQLYRMRLDGGNRQRMTCGPGVDWFPHPSPDGRQVAFLRYPPGTLGHPADHLVDIVLMPIEGGAARTMATLYGGQGTINVNSWSPDGSRLAYIAYPNDELGERQRDAVRAPTAI